MLALLVTVFSMACYKIVIQPFLMMYRGRSLRLLYFPGIYHENTSDWWDILWFTTKKCGITSMYSILQLNFV